MGKQEGFAGLPEYWQPTGITPGATQPPATGLVKFVPRILSDYGMVTEAEIAHYELPLATYYLAADVEKILQGVVRYLAKQVLYHDPLCVMGINEDYRPCSCGHEEAQQLLAQLRGGGA